MRFIPLHGTDTIPFGSSLEHVVGTFGEPDSARQLVDLESHPKGRQSLTFGPLTITIGAKIGVFGINCEPIEAPLHLWDTLINDCTTEDFVAMLKARGAESETAPPSPYGATDVFSADHGILAYFSGKKITSLAILVPHSTPSEQS